jgi:hypothetical protein
MFLALSGEESGTERDDVTGFPPASPAAKAGCGDARKRRARGAGRRDFTDDFLIGSRIKRGTKALSSTAPPSFPWDSPS